MITINFRYNLPSTNCKNGSNNVFIDVQATLLDECIAIEFPMLGLGSLLQVVDWYKAKDHIKEMAQNKFNQALQPTQKEAA